MAAVNTPTNDAQNLRELERIHANTELLESLYGSPDRTLSGSSTSIGSGLISALGKAALRGIVRDGAHFAFLALMTHMGMASDSFESQIDQLQSSMDTLNSQVAQITSAIEQLQDETTWQGFLNHHKDANIAANLIYANFGYVTAWVASGIEVDEIAWTNARRNISDSLTILAGARMNASGGIIDSQHAAIYQLINPIPQRVASVASYWPLVDDYRDYYRAALAIGFLGLDLIEDAYDGSGTTRVMFMPSP